MYLNAKRAITTAQAPSVSREESDLEVASSSRNILGLEKIRQLLFIISDETSTSFPKLNTTGRSLFIKFKFPGEEQEPTAYLKECITALTNYLVDELGDSDLVVLRIRNTKNMQEEVFGISFRRRDQLQPDLFCEILSKVIQSNARFGLTDRLEVHLCHVRMPAGNAKRSEKTKVRSFDVMSAIKKSIVVVKAAFVFGSLTNNYYDSIKW